MLRPLWTWFPKQPRKNNIDVISYYAAGFLACCIKYSMNKKLLFLIIGVIVIVGLTVLILSRVRTSDFSGTYRLKQGGKGEDTMIHIALNGSTYSIEIDGVKDLHATYQARKTWRNILTITDNSDGNKTSEYELRHTNRGLEGKVWVLPIGEVDVFFEKVKD